MSKFDIYLGFSGFVQGMATKSNGRQLILSGPQHVVFVVVVVVTRPDGTVNFWSMTMLRLFLLLLLVPTSGTGSRSLLTQPPPEKIQDNSFVELVWWPTATTSVPIESQLQIENNDEMLTINPWQEETTILCIFLSFYLYYRLLETVKNEFTPLPPNPSLGWNTLDFRFHFRIVHGTCDAASSHTQPVHHHSTSSAITLRFHAESISQYGHIRRLSHWANF